MGCRARACHTLATGTRRQARWQTASRTVWRGSVLNMFELSNARSMAIGRASASELTHARNNFRPAARLA
eukprot:5283808-Alexandrium_andersonii.AAC.1